MKALDDVIVEREYLRHAVHERTRNDVSFIRPGGENMHDMMLKELNISNQSGFNGINHTLLDYTRLQSLPDNKNEDIPFLDIKDGNSSNAEFIDLLVSGSAWITPKGQAPKLHIPTSLQNNAKNIDKRELETIEASIGEYHEFSIDEKDPQSSLIPYRRIEKKKKDEYNTRKRKISEEELDDDEPEFEGNCRKVGASCNLV